MISLSLMTLSNSYLQIIEKISLIFNGDTVSNFTLHALKFPLLSEYSPGPLQTASAHSIGMSIVSYGYLDIFCNDLQ